MGQNGIKFKLLAKDCIANRGIALEIFWVFSGFLGFESVFGYGVFANQPTVHSGGLSRGGSVTVAVGFSDS